MIPNPLLHCELALHNYVTSSMLASGSGVILPSNVVFLSGTSTEEKSGPAIFTNVNSSDEVVMYSRVYAFDVSIQAKDTAYDTTVDSYSTLGGEVMALFGDSDKAKTTINNTAENFRVFQIQHMGSRVERVLDSFVTTLTLRVVGCLVA